MKCNACNLLTDLPFHCKYCDLYFCGDHQLPENHKCEKLWLAAPPTKYSESSINTDFSYPSSIIKTNKFQFPNNEKIHLLVGTILVMLVGLTLNTNLLFQIPIIYGLIMALAFSCSFLGHELAHKFMAQHYGLWAEFRLVKIGAILTLISILPFLFFKIIAPGAIILRNSTDTKTLGRIAVVGPIFNLVIGFICLIGLNILNFIYAPPFFGSLFIWLGFINSFMALFNLIPFGIFDGQKIYTWNKLIWIIMLGISVIMFFSFR